MQIESFVARIVADVLVVDGRGWLHVVDHVLDQGRVFFYFVDSFADLRMFGEECFGHESLRADEALKRPTFLLGVRHMGFGFAVLEVVALVADENIAQSALEGRRRHRPCFALVLKSRNVAVKVFVVVVTEPTRNACKFVHYFILRICF